MTLQPFEPPRMPCKKCDGPAGQHANDKCLFQSTTYDPIAWGELYAWCVRTGLDHRGGANAEELPLTVTMMDGVLVFDVTCFPNDDNIEYVLHTDTRWVDV